MPKALYHVGWLSCHPGRLRTPVALIKRATQVLRQADSACLSFERLIVRDKLLEKVFCQRLRFGVANLFDDLAAFDRRELPRDHCARRRELRRCFACDLAAADSSAGLDNCILHAASHLR